ncbi:NAD(P)/FAD-dependent oxidoreductase [Nocardioides sp. LHD-245]|uniref:FAD-dependent oxidoreductase n=1 Tax=Nocardioides sp. LHD-245 TaxID=3051387 RepID=UPI0027E12DE0|nr:NAD(P)/FAD-dependent oxidoreductase [Nocardioides sp. LHD-245]
MASSASVTVVGGGPHGLLVALALARSDIEVTLLEAQSSEPSSSPRAMMFHWSMLGGLDRLGVLDDAVARGLVHRRWSIYVLATGERLYFDLDVLADDVQHPFTLHLPQQTLAEIVIARLAALPNVHVEWDTRVQRVEQDADGCTVTADAPGGERSYRSDWVVGADGVHSMVRRSAGLGLPGITWPERFVATNVRFDFASLGHELSGVQLDAQDGALVAKVDDSGLWRYTYAEDLALPEETLGERMRDRFRRVLPDGVDVEVEAYGAHRMHQRVADRFRAGRLLLIGDAAHVTSPSAGYGLPGGFFDGMTLVEALREVIHFGADEEILDRFSEERRRVFTNLTSPVSSEHKQMLWNSEGPGRIEAEVERFRHITASPSRQRQFLLVGRGLQSAPLRSMRKVGATEPG